MHPSITILLSALALVAALPTLPPRACTTLYPNALFSLVSPPPPGGFFDSGLRQAQEDTTLRAILNSPHVRLQRLQGSENNAQDMFQFVDFKIPAGSNSCQLEIVDSARKLYFEKNDEINATPPPLNIMSITPGALCEDPSTENVTYADVMTTNPPVIQSYHWGSATLTRGGHAIINSFPCPAPNANGEDGHAQFVFQFDPDQVGGGYSDWALPQSTTAVEAITGVNGIYLTHC